MYLDFKNADSALHAGQLGKILIISYYLLEPFQYYQFLPYFCNLDKKVFTIPNIFLNLQFFEPHYCVCSSIYFPGASLHISLVTFWH